MAMSTQATEDLFRRVFDPLNDREFDTCAETHATDISLHNPDKKIHGVEAVIDLDRPLYDAFPDMEYHPEDVLAKDNQVAGRWIVTGTHDREFEGTNPTSAEIDIQAFRVFRSEERNIAEIWLTDDRLGLIDSASSRSRVSNAIARTHGTPNDLGR